MHILETVEPKKNDGPTQYRFGTEMHNKQSNTKIIVFHW